VTETVLNSRSSLESYCQYLHLQWEKHKYLRLTLKTGKQRSNAQNAALQVCCRLWADALNDAGYEFKLQLDPGVEAPWGMGIPWNGELVKKCWWVPAQVAITGKTSTTQPTRQQYFEIYEALNLFFGTEYGIFVPWPEKDHAD